jgi:GNAT superfamily N-acetyltransferase
MEYRKLYEEDIELFKIFYQDNPFNENEDDLQDRIGEIEDELRINKFKYFGYIEEDKLLGYAKFRVEENEAHLIGPFILPEYRRKGLGKNIIQRIENYCTYQKLSRLNAYSFIDETLADNFLTSIGYKRESVSELGINVYAKEF